MGSISVILTTLLHFGYAALFVIVLLSAVYFPLPSSIALLVAGALAHTSQDGVHFNIFIAALVGFGANVLGDIGSYYIARQFYDGNRRDKFAKKHKYLAKIERHLKKHPMMTIGVTRFVGFVSPVVNTLAGYTKLHATTFIISDLLGDAFYVVIFIAAGYFIGSAGGHSYELIGGVTTALLVLVLIYAGALVFLRKEE